MVLFAVQAGVVVRAVKGGTKKSAEVASGSIGSLKVMTTGADGETVARFAGTVERMVG